jgi:hypothetical protein
MRWAPGTVLIVLLLLTESLYPQSTNRELTRRDGVLAKVFLKACNKLTTAAVDFDGSGNPYEVEWWRCGSKKPKWEAGKFPVHYVLIRPPKDKSQVLPLTLSNSGNSDEYFIDQLHLIDAPVGSRQLLLISGKYYESDQGHIECALERVSDQFECSASVEARYSPQEHLRFHGANLLRKLGQYLDSPP